MHQGPLVEGGMKAQELRVPRGGDSLTPHRPVNLPPRAGKGLSLILAGGSEEGGKKPQASFKFTSARAASAGPALCLSQPYGACP